MWNNTDVGVLNIIESFCGGNTDGTRCGIFHGNDQVYPSDLCGSPNYLIIGYHWGSNTPHTSLAYGGFCSFTRDVGLHTDASTNASDTYPEVCIRLSKN